MQFLEEEATISTKRFQRVILKLLKYSCKTSIKEIKLQAVGESLWYDKEHKLLFIHRGEWGNIGCLRETAN